MFLSVTHAQSPATAAGSQFLSGAASFTSQGGDLHDYTGNTRQNNWMLTPTYLYFIIEKLGIGGNLSYDRESQGSNSFTTWGIGPKASYFFDSGQKTIPFAAFSANYASIGVDGETQGGMAFVLSGGETIRMGKLAIILEAGYRVERFKFDGAEEATSGNTFFLAVGFGAFLFGN